MPATGPVKLKLETFKPPGRREGKNHVADAAEVSTGQQTTKLKLLDSLVNGSGDSLQAGEMPGTYVPAAYSPPHPLWCVARDKQ